MFISKYILLYLNLSFVNALNDNVISIRVCWQNVNYSGTLHEIGHFLSCILYDLVSLV